ncbi:hypothetical protein EST38_g6334 [Candolleomyces aberdarensis]|uniref:Peroxisomal membrane protein PMP22 n=1 Tax=Candolleomyces aberdarensis TaxID=2316362 RepID=A0A4Q2DL81_9AGAR|nr:hypothetical protein EST38_g6334 [Candolleomyces aberdarensis]
MSAPPAKKINPLLAKYLAQLALHPLRTKALTTGILCFLQEILGSKLAGVPIRAAKDSSPIVHALAAVSIDVKAFKMGLYGFLVSAPLSHYLVSQLQKAFAGKTSPAAKASQILANNLLVAPVQTAAFLSSMAVINGATSLPEIIKTVKAGFFSVIRIQWVVSPVSLLIAQKFIPVELWVLFFNAIQFTFGTYFNYRVKKLKLAALKKEKEKQRDDKGPSSS